MAESTKLSVMEQVLQLQNSGLLASNSVITIDPDGRISIQTVDAKSAAQDISLPDDTAIKDGMKSIPYFKGSKCESDGPHFKPQSNNLTVHRWLQMLEDNFSRLKVTCDAQKISLAKERIDSSEGSASIAASNHLVCEVKDNWKNWKSVFVKQLYQQSISVTKKLNEIENFRWDYRFGESCDLMKSRWDKLMNELNISLSIIPNQKLVDHVSKMWLFSKLYNQLPDNSRKTISDIKDFTKPRDKLLEDIVECFRILDDSVKLSNTMSLANFESNSKRNNYNDSKLNPSDRLFNRNAEELRTRGGSECCYRCKLPGHIAKFCRTCFECQNAGNQHCICPDKNLWHNRPNKMSLLGHVPSWVLNNSEPERPPHYAGCLDGKNILPARENYMPLRMLMCGRCNLSGHPAKYCMTCLECKSKGQLQCDCPKRNIRPMPTHFKNKHIYGRKENQFVPSHQNNDRVNVQKDYSDPNSNRNSHQNRQTPPPGSVGGNGRQCYNCQNLNKLFCDCRQGRPDRGRTQRSRPGMRTGSSICCSNCGIPGHNASTCKNLCVVCKDNGETRCACLGKKESTSSSITALCAQGSLDLKSESSEVSYHFDELDNVNNSDSDKPKSNDESCNLDEMPIKEFAKDTWGEVPANTENLDNWEKY